MKLNKRIGFGTWQLAGESTFAGRVTGWGKTDLEEAKRAIQHAIDEGIDFFDTADTYGQGFSESILGETIGNNPNVCVCTKYGNLESPSGQHQQDFSEQYLRQAVEASLKRLQRERLDVLLLHSPPDYFDWKNYNTEPYEKLIREGKIGQYGVSSKSWKGANKVIESGFGSVIEVIYNALDRRAEELFPLCQQKNIDLIARVPLASGFLSPKTLEMIPNFEENDIRSQISADAAQWFIENVRNLAFLNELEGGISVSALRFCISSPAVSVAIPGIRKVNHAKQAVLASSLESLSPEIIKKIEQTVPDVFYKWR